ncbi:MAG: peptidylprolyl isomerase [Parcubacteria group bacterium]|nr:peptidylprolyl isomerase [Parcubacteria group bacterium]
MKTNQGDITIELFNDKSPKTVENFVKLAKDGFYDGTRFHRVIKDFMIQSGDPQSKDVALADRWGTGGPGYQFADEFNDEKLVRGSLAMANSGPNTNGSQFFIVTLDATPWLDGLHTNFGMVTEGLDVVLGIEKTATGPGDRPLADMLINSIEVK